MTSAADRPTWLTPRLAWERDDLPQGDEKVEAVRAMFDAIAPRYDLVNRVMTFRLDVRLAPRERWPPSASTDGSLVLDLASGTGDLCVDLNRAGYLAVSVDLSFGMLAADRSGAPRVAGRHPRSCPCPAASVDGVTCGFALRNLRRACPRSSPSWPGSCGRAVASPCSTSPCPPNAVLRWGHGIYFGRVVPWIGGLLSDPAAYRYLPKSVAYLPAARRDARRRSAAPGSSTPGASC